MHDSSWYDTRCSFPCHAAGEQRDHLAGESPADWEGQLRKACQSGPESAGAGRKWGSIWKRPEHVHCNSAEAGCQAIRQSLPIDYIDALLAASVELVLLRLTVLKLSGNVLNTILHTLSRHSASKQGSWHAVQLSAAMQSTALWRLCILVPALTKLV